MQLEGCVNQPNNCKFNRGKEWYSQTHRMIANLVGLSSQPNKRKPRASHIQTIWAMVKQPWKICFFCHVLRCRQHKRCSDTNPQCFVWRVFLRGKVACLVVQTSPKYEIISKQVSWMEIWSINCTPKCFWVGRQPIWQVTLGSLCFLQYHLAQGSTLRSWGKLGWPVDHLEIHLSTFLKFNIDTENSHIWKEIHFPTHHFGYSC